MFKKGQGLKGLLFLKKAGKVCCFVLHGVFFKCMSDTWAYGDHGDPSPGAEDVVPDNLISGGPPYLMDLSMRAPKKMSDTFFPL